MKKKNKTIFRVGTSNVVMPGGKETFPEEFQCKSRLCYYSSLLNSVELNSTFKKIPMPRTFEKWDMEVEEDFTFTIKLWREITHVKKLAIDLENIDRFMEAAGHMKKKACILIQFPGSITFDFFSQVENILERVEQCDPEKEWRIAVEFRNDSWYTGETMELLDEYGASLVMHDITKGRNTEVNRKAKFVYLRYHGPKGDYRGSYSDAFLESQAERVQYFLNEGKDVYVYFNNTVGEAFENARKLKEIIELS